MILLALGICNEPPTAEEFLHLAVQCILYDPDDSDYADVVKHSMKAWAALREKELEEAGHPDTEIKWASESRAEDIFRKNYLKVRPREDDCWWPDALPYNADLPVVFLAEIGKTLARKHLREDKAFYAYMKKHHEENDNSATSG
jgi:hypothetical protein